MGAGATQIVGREAEREAIERWLDGERPGALVLDGEAGIGKSTLWVYGLERAAARGDRVLAWRASAAERGLAFAALLGLLDQPALAPATQRLAPPRRRALEVALGRADPAGEPSQPTLVALAVADVLRILAADRPLLIGIDDVQWCDRASDETLAFALRRLRDERVAFLPARRGGEPPAEVCTALDRVERMRVGSLSVGALGRLVRRRLGVAHPRPLLARIHQECSGNPFLALEISRSLTSRTAAPAPGEPFPVPAEAGALVRDHLAGLSAEARRVVVLVAMSPEPSLALVERTLGTKEVGAVDEACAKGVLTEDGARLGACHPLFTSTAYADASPGERRRLRRLLAAATDDPVARAIHLCAVSDVPDGETAQALAVAGRLASGRGAPGVAADLLERAAALTSDSHARAALLTEAAQAAAAAGDSARAESALRGVVQFIHGGSLRAQALLALGEIVYVERPNEALPLLLEALAHTEADESLEARVHSHLAGMADMNPAAAHHGAERAAEILDRHGTAEPGHLACALLEREFHRLLNGLPVDPAHLERGLRLRDPTGHSFISRRAQEVAERCLFHLGRLDEARALDEAEYHRLVETGQYGLLPPLVQALSVLAQLSGDWGAARRYADECEELVAQGEPEWRARAVLARARILAWEGDLDSARAQAAPALARQEQAGDRWEAAIFCALLGFVELSVPDPQAALGFLERALAHADAIEVHLPSQFRFLGDLVEAAVLAGELPLAEQVLTERLEEPARSQPLPWTVAMAHRGHGLYLAAQGKTDDALYYFDMSLDVFARTLTMPFEQARTWYARGQTHRRAGHWRAAREDLTAAREAFDALGAKAWLARATSELSRVGGRAPAGSALTTAEHAVALLAARGRSNREIAAELVVSVRTVESQLASTYRKLDIRSRRQLAAALPAVTSGR